MFRFQGVLLLGSGLLVACGENSAQPTDAATQSRDAAGDEQADAHAPASEGGATLDDDSTAEGGAFDAGLEPSDAGLGNASGQLDSTDADATGSEPHAAHVDAAAEDDSGSSLDERAPAIDGGNATSGAPDAGNRSNGEASAGDTPEAGSGAPNVVEAGSATPDGAAPANEFDAAPAIEAGDVGMPASIALSQRIYAATQTASSTTGACSSIRPFYWEVGDVEQRLAGGSLKLEGDETEYTASSRINLGSASKWLYAAYVAQIRQGNLEGADIDALTLTSGFTSMTECYPDESVRICFRSYDNDVYTSEHAGKFYYDGGHMQRHAVVVFDLGPLSRNDLAQEVRTQLGSGVSVGYSLAMLAGGANGTAEGIAVFLQALMSDQLYLGQMLGSYAVCADPATCPDAVYSPTPPGVAWHYSLGHWVEDDPATGDGAFSSPGALGFYPWITADKQFYGVISRDSGVGNWASSGECGRQIRRAWDTGLAAD